MPPFPCCPHCHKGFLALDDSFEEMGPSQSTQALVCVHCQHRFGTMPHIPRHPRSPPLNREPLRRPIPQSAGLSR